MAIKKIRMRPEGVNDYGDVLYPETSADQVIDTEKEKTIKEIVDGHMAEEATNAHLPINVGLGNVKNYGIATKMQAETGVATNVYMTPLRVKESVIANTLEKSMMITGTYIGDGASTRTIVLGVKPKALFLTSDKYLYLNTSSGSLFTGFALQDAPLGYVAGDNLATITSDGFSVVLKRTNETGTKYSYVAFI